MSRSGSAAGGGHRGHDESLKQYAVAAVPAGHRDGRPGLLCVWDEEDWRWMRTRPRPVLMCFHPGCQQLLHTQNRAGTRVLCRNPGQPDCGHVHPNARLVRTAGTSSGGGPMSPQHRWLQQRLLRICQALGYEGHLEDSLTCADVYLPGVRWALEVQRWPTAFRERTAARQARGAQVVWLLPADGKPPADLWRQPAVLLKTYPRGARLMDNLTVQPWEDLDEDRDDPDSDDQGSGGRDVKERGVKERGIKERGVVGRDPELVVRRHEQRGALLAVYGTVARLEQRDGAPRLRTSPLDARRFLDEVITGRRRWIPPGTPGVAVNGRQFGLWVLLDDLATLEAHRRGTRFPATAAPAPGTATPASAVAEDVPQRDVAALEGPSIVAGGPHAPAGAADGSAAAVSVPGSSLAGNTVEGRSWWRRLLGWRR